MMENKTNQPEGTPAPKVRKITPLDLLKRDVKLYRADCMMSVGNDKKCRPCTAGFFESILGMIDRIALQEAIARQERKTGKWIYVHPLQEDDGGAYKCSCCSSGSWVVDPTTWRACPWCMALMETERRQEVDK